MSGPSDVSKCPYSVGLGSARNSDDVCFVSRSPLYSTFTSENNLGETCGSLEGRHERLRWKWERSLRAHLDSRGYARNALRASKSTVTGHWGSWVAGDMW